jgi:hypothetical protein
MLAFYISVSGVLSACYDFLFSGMSDVQPKSCVTTGAFFFIMIIKGGGTNCSQMYTSTFKVNSIRDI